MLVLLVLLAGTLSSLIGVEAAQRPNVLLILADDLVIVAQTLQYSQVLIAMFIRDMETLR